MHLTTVRLFVESTLRYGLPPVFQGAVVKPVDKKETELRKVLANVFTDGKPTHAHTHTHTHSAETPSPYSNTMHGQVADISAPWKAAVCDVCVCVCV